MPFEKGDERINRLERTPEKFTKEFVDYVCHLYASNVPTSKMSEILNIPENTVNKYLNKQVVWFNDLNSNDMQEVSRRLCCRDETVGCRGTCQVREYYGE